MDFLGRFFRCTGDGFMSWKMARKFLILLAY